TISSSLRRRWAALFSALFAWLAPAFLTIPLPGDCIAMQQNREIQSASSKKEAVPAGTASRSDRLVLLCQTAYRLSRPAIGVGFGHLRQLLIGRLFLVQGLIEQGRRIVAAHLLGPRNERSVTRHLVVFDRLRGSNERRVEHGLVLDFAGNILGLFDDAIDRRAVDALGLLPEQIEYLIKPFYVIFGFAQVGLKSLFELRITRLLDHFRQRFHDLLLGVVDVAQRVHE